MTAEERRRREMAAFVAGGALLTGYVETQLRELQARMTRDLDGEAGRVVSGAQSLADFWQHAQERLMYSHSRAAVLGAVLGAGAITSPSMRVAVEAAARAGKAQNEFLQGFVKDLAAGRYRPKSQGGEGARARRARFKLYGLALLGTANLAWARTIGHVRVLWVLGVTDNHCPDCVWESYAGWRYPEQMRRFPGDGLTRCIVMCRCRLVTEDGRESFSRR